MTSRQTNEAIINLSETVKINPEGTCRPTWPEVVPFFLSHSRHQNDTKKFVICLLHANSVDFCGLQETKIPMNYPEHLLNIVGFTLELENNTEKNVLAYILEIKFLIIEDLTWKKKILIY